MCTSSKSRAVGDLPKTERYSNFVILEAMKMEHRLTAPRDGKISRMTEVKVGGQVKEGDFMFELEDE